MWILLVVGLCQATSVVPASVAIDQQIGMAAGKPARCEQAATLNDLLSRLRLQQFDCGLIDPEKRSYSVIDAEAVIEPPDHAHGPFATFT